MNEERKKRRDAYNKSLEERKRHPGYINTKGPNLISECMMQKMGMGKSYYYLRPVKEGDLKET